MTQPCPRCKERGTEGQLMKAPGDSVASCLQCGYEAVDIVSKPKKDSPPKRKRVLINTDNPFPCPSCKQTFKYQGALENHIAKNHQLEEPTVRMEAYARAHPTTFSKTFVCPVCHKPFDKKIQLDGHMATHSDRPTDSMGVLEQAEKVLRKNIVASEDGQKDKLKEARRHVLEAIEVLL